MQRFLRWSLVIAGCLVAVPVLGQAQDSRPAGSRAGGLFAQESLKKAEAGAGLDQIQRALTVIDRSKTFKPAANDEITRGAAGALYPKIAPATVLVRTVHGHGTGFIVDPEGWIVTNHHVVADGDVDVKTGSRVVLVYTGQIKNGLMEVNEQPLTARVHVANQEKDLAVLKLDRKPATPLTAIPLAKGTPTPGLECVVFGHPAAGMLWTVRSGEVAGVGTWPKDTIDAVMARLTLTGTDKATLERQLAAAAPRRVVVSSCGINPGDSGGPLVNKDGELIAVTFAIPRSDPASGISYDKISYHVHVSEVQSVLADKPATAPIYVPDVWPPALLSLFRDRDQDGRDDTLVFGVERDQPPTGIFYDLDQDSPANIDPGKMDEAAERAKWDFEFAVQLTPRVRTFYDTNNDGKLDLILTDLEDDGKSDLDLRLVAGKWQRVVHDATAPPSKTVDATLFTDKALQAKFTRFVAGGPGTAAPPAEPMPEPGRLKNK